MKIAVGNSRMDKKWKNRDIAWEDFKDTVRTTKRTTETVLEFRKMSRSRQDSIKDFGGFVGGALREGRRRNGNVLCRSLLTLDMDYATPGIWEQIDSLHDWSCCVYSTHKHTPEAPRLRIIIPLSTPPWGVWWLKKSLGAPVVASTCLTTLPMKLRG